MDGWGSWCSVNVTPPKRGGKDWLSKKQKTCLGKKPTSSFHSLTFASTLDREFLYTVRLEKSKNVPAVTF